MKVSDRIWKLLSDHKQTMGTVPTCIYLGQSEYMSLLNEVFKHGSPVDTFERKCFGIDYFDLPIKNHLNVSFVKK